MDDQLSEVSIWCLTNAQLANAIFVLTDRPEYNRDRMSYCFIDRDMATILVGLDRKLDAGKLRKRRDLRYFRLGKTIYIRPAD